MAKTYGDNGLNCQCTLNARRVENASQIASQDLGVRRTSHVVDNFREHLHSGYVAVGLW